jgi:CheY-like chemotaxis protein
MINVLLVDDDDQKSAKVQAVIHQLVEQHGVIVERARTAHDAVTALRRKRHLDLMIVDLNIPLREGADPTPVGGVRLIESLSEKVNSDLGTPVHIVGLTAFDPLIQQYEKFFDDRLWHLVRFSAESNDWVSQIGKKLVHIAETKLPARRDNYEVDLAIVTALHHVELESVLALDAGWQQQQFAEDETLYHMGEFRRDSKSLRVVAAAAVEMGMPAATALSMNVITRFRPRYLAMAGIAAGIKGNFGDILIATHSWDYGCGKSRFQLGRSEFLPAPSQVQLNPLLKSKLRVLRQV